MRNRFLLDLVYVTGDCFRNQCEIEHQNTLENQLFWSNSLFPTYDMIEETISRKNVSVAFDYSKEGGTMGGLHLLDLIVILAIVLLIAGPKALQSISRNAGKGVGQAKTMKDKVMAELPMEEISEILNTLSKIPLSPQQAVQKLLLPEQENKKSETKQEVKKESSPSSAE